MKFSLVVSFSLLLSLTTLGIERAVGIDWDFHPDSVTYATTSGEAYQSIMNDWMELFNNGYYVLSYALDQSIVAITLMNTILFAVTNGIIYKSIKNRANYPINIHLLSLLLLNPYRIHLSTTMLKDTLIIFLMVLLVTSPFASRAVSFFGMVVLRIASPIYLIALVPKRFVLYAALGGLALTSATWDTLVVRVLEFNAMEMQLRDFDKVPTFQEFGFWGAILRGITWSILSFTGAFALISPAPAFIPVAIGSLMTLIFLKKTTGHYRIPTQLFIATSIFGIMVTGFTAYIRYVYPILVAWPIIAVTRDD